VSGDIRSSPVAFSPAEKRALEALAELDRRNRHAGADLRMEAYRITEGLPRLRAWLAESDRLVDERPGSKRLRSRRRRGILRETEGLERGRPYFDPPMYPTTDAPEPRTYFLKDELEAIVIAGRIEGGRWRPARDELMFDELRALAGMKAGTLYRRTWRKKTDKDAVPGRIWREDQDERSHAMDLRFDTMEALGWIVIVINLFRKK
jgi:hypothetical protein